MQLKTLQIGTDLREHFPYSCNAIPLSICIENFDDYLYREWGCHWHEEIEFPDDQPLLSGIQEICSITDRETGYELHFIETVCKIWRLLTIRILHDKQTGRIPAANKVQEQRMKQLLSFIHGHYSEHISIDDIAKSASISRTECFRCFHAIIKKSPSEYLTEYRLSMASMMLANTDRTLSDISCSCGFNSPSYFGKLFREKCGLPPKKYRDQMSIQK